LTELRHSQLFAGRLPQHRRSVIRLLLLALVVLAGALTIGTRARAQNYPWCAVYNVGAWAYSCSFVTENQCWDSVHGIGGFCMVNNTYQPSAPAPYSRRRHQHS
jgi:hypothetical protein